VDFSEVLRRRRMVREYDTTRPVPAELRERLLTHALRAPSAGFSQGWAFLTLESADSRERFWEAICDDGSRDPAAPGPEGWPSPMATAPLLIVPFSHKQAYLQRYSEADKPAGAGDEATWVAPYWDIDTGMASLLILLTAVDEGLGACLFGFRPDRVSRLRQAFGAPEEYAPIGCLSVGYPAATDQPRVPRRPRRAIADVVHLEHW
jgi:nitroreductase